VTPRAMLNEIIFVPRRWLPVGCYGRTAYVMLTARCVSHLQWEYDFDMFHWGVFGNP
jgi:hypothetical protein